MISRAWISIEFQNSNVLSVEVFSLIEGVTEFNTVRFREQESHETSDDGESSKNSLFWKIKKGLKKKKVLRVSKRKQKTSCAIWG